MMELEVFGESAAMATVAELLDGPDGSHRVMQVEATRAGHSVVSGAVRPRALDAVLEELHLLDVPDADITVTRVEVVDGRHAASEASLVWADVLGPPGTTRGRSGATWCSCSSPASSPATA